jgi:hypothetical protein
MPKRFKKGDPLKISAYAWNRMLDMVGFDVDQNSDWRKGAFHTDWFYCKVLHDSDDVTALPDGVLPRGSPVKVKKPTSLTGVEIVEYEINPQDFIHTAEFISMEDSMHDILGITMEPINLNVGQSFIGRVAVNGLVYANLEFAGAAVSSMTSEQRTLFRYVHPYPSSNVKYRTTLQVNSSGVAQMLGDSIVLGRGQPLYTYVTTASGNGEHTTADIYGLSNANVNGYLIAEDAIIYHSNRKYHYAGMGEVDYPPFALGDIGICIKDGPNYSAITSNGLGQVAITDGTGTARVGDQPGTGVALLHYLDNSALPYTLQPMRDANGDPVSVVYFNSSSSTIATGKWIQLKDVHGSLWVDVEDCPT